MQRIVLTSVFINPILVKSANKGYDVIAQWMASKGHEPFLFQTTTWAAIEKNKSGLVNAPTGCGKTFAVFLGAVIQFINAHPQTYSSTKNNSLQLIWITPLRALAKDIGRAMEQALLELSIPWQVGIRNGDTGTAERQQQKRKMPEILIITPESLHLLLASKNYPALFEKLRIIAVDEWHELMGSKRGVQVELALSRLVHCSLRKQALSVWGISATIGNLAEAMEVLMLPVGVKGQLIKAQIDKQIIVQSIYPDEIEKYPWAGHLGIKLAHKLVPIIEANTTTLIFINTRGMSEMWYQALLTAAPQLAGAIALHHGSIEPELRTWVEDNLHTGKLKAVVCTASLDLGVDFRPVDTVIQVGSPKGVARFLQRAGRSGHQPNAPSKIYFLPTHSLELMEVAALKNAIAEQFIESKVPQLLCFDVLLQYLCTLAVSDGFIPATIYKEIRQTYCYQDLSENEWQEVLYFLTEGGNSLQAYDDFKKIEVVDGRFQITNRRTAMRHRMHIGTIVSDAMLKVKFISGGFVGTIEEWFIARLQPGDVFTLAGRNVEFVRIKDMTVQVKKSTSKKSIVPSWMGGRMPLSANLGKKLRETLQIAGNTKALKATPELEELHMLQPLFQLQQQLSIIPGKNELLIEHIETKNGFHVFVYPFEGRLVHEALAAILAWRISKITPITFSIAMNDYGFELLSDQPIPLDDTNVYEIFSTDNLLADIQKSVNATEMAKRKFRDIAVIGGLIFQGMPGEQMKSRHLQSNAGLLFNVFNEYDSNNVLLRQAFREVFDQQMEEVRLREAMDRICKGKIILQFPTQLTPFCFPIIADGLNRNNLSSEKIEDRIKKMQAQLGKA
ncbi:MAG: ligase-associated DNA damage response DEXH box helicase [Ferruginibacter sp.]